MLLVNVQNPTTSVKDLSPLDTFYYNSDLWLLSNSADSRGFRLAINLTTGSLTGLSGDTSVVRVHTTLTATADIKAMEDMIDI